MNTPTETSHFISKPSPGKTMEGFIKQYGKIFHNVYKCILLEIRRNETKIDEEYFHNILLFKYPEADLHLLEEKRNSIISSSLILNWICGRILNKIPKEANLTDAEVWFHSNNPENCITSFISINIQKSILEAFKELDFELILESLPYLSEVFETGSEIINEKGANRKKKKKHGVYYTPTDVIDFMVRHSVKRHNSKELKKSLWFDPALGTGNYLISVLKYFYKENLLKSASEFASKQIFGTDISPIAIQSSTYILATTCLKLDSEYHVGLKELASHIGCNLALSDSTKLGSKADLCKLFPKIDIEGVDFVISNPPYSKKQKNQLSLFPISPSHKSELNDTIYPDFLKLIFKLTKKNNGGGSMVVPLSLVANSNNQFRGLRKYLQEKNGVLEFWNFDRTPDSLFGDDVKTRNTIFFYTNPKSAKDTAKIISTYLHRWSSRNRSHLFNSIPTVFFNQKFDIAAGIPKIGDSLGLDILDKIIKKSNGNISNVLLPYMTDGDIKIKNTAYNWIPIELNHNKGTTGGTLWKVISNKIAPVEIYAVLNSRLTYWLWRIWSDGFHVTNRFIKHLPFGNEFFDNINNEELNSLGTELWQTIRKEVIVSRNAGVTSYSYCPYFANSTLDKIDLILIKYFRLPQETLQYLKIHIEKTIMAGRQNEEGINKKLK